MFKLNNKFKDMAVSPPSSPKFNRLTPSSPERLGAMKLSQVPKVEGIVTQVFKSKRRRDNFSDSMGSPSTKRPRVAQDRLIPTVNRGGAVVYNDPMPKRLKSARESTYQAVLSQGIFGSFRDPHSEPVLRDRPSKMSFEPPLKIPQSESYSRSLTFEMTDVRELDLSAICEGLHTLPLAYCDDVLSVIRSYSDSRDPVTGDLCAGARMNVWFPGESRVEGIPPGRDLRGDSKPISMAIAPEGELFVFAKENGEIEGWELTDKTPEKLFEIKAQNESKMISLGISDQSIFAGDHQGRLYQFDRDKKALIHTFKDHEKCISKIVISPNGKYLATGGLDRQVVIYNTATMKKLHSVQVKDEIKAIVFDPTGNPNIALGVGGAESLICIVKSPNPPKEVALIEFPVDSQISSLQWPMANRMISTHADAFFRVIPIDLRRKSPFGQSRRIASTAMVHSGDERNFSAVIRYREPKYLILGSTNLSLETVILPVLKDENPQKAPLSKLDGVIPLIR